MNGNGILGGLISFIALTFFVAIGYGLFLTTVDFTQPNYSPITSGHRAASNVYGVFGTVSAEIKNSEAEPGRPTSTVHKIAEPYAVTADVSAILGGKLEQSLASIFHAVGVRSNGGNPATS